MDAMRKRSNTWQLLGSNQIAKPANSSKGYQIRGKKSCWSGTGTQAWTWQRATAGKVPPQAGRSKAQLIFNCRASLELAILRGLDERPQELSAGHSCRSLKNSGADAMRAH